MPGLGLGLGLDFLDAGTKVLDNAFKITVDTTQAGSASDTFVLPLHNGTSYDFEVDWGDGNVESVSGSSLTNKSHTYSSGGTYQIAITGTFPRIYFNNTGDKLKLSSIDNWGDIVWSSMLNAFYGCSNMVGTYTDVPNTSSVTSMVNMFLNCSSFNSPVNFDTSSATNMNSMFNGCSSFNQSVSNFDTSNVTNMGAIFRNCSSFNQSVSSFDTSNVTNMGAMFLNCSSFKQSLSTFDMTSVTNVTDMLSGCDINEAGTTTNYDNTLIAWELQDLVDGLSFNGGTSKYSSTGETARDAIINDDSWVITDGGIAEGILDLYTGAAAAYSLRQLATGSQTVVRVRRSSDNAEDDFTATEVVDGTMLTWVGTTASDNGFVTTWYDQAGSNDATQATAARQPKIVDAGVLVEENNRPAVEFLDNNSLNFTNILPVTTFTVAKINTISKPLHYILYNELDIKGYYYGGTLSGVDGIGFFDGTNTNNITGEDTNRHLAYFYYDGSSFDVAKDGGVATNFTPASNFEINRIGRIHIADLSINGPVQEIIIYPSDQSSNRVGIENQINSHYNIYP